MTKPIIYFLCTGNSCRSQMAEGFGKKYLGDRYEVRSAGIEAHGLNPKAVEVMREAGVDISGQQSETIDPGLLSKAAYVITLCGDAEERCPLTPSGVKRLHWGMEDPAKAGGIEVFRRVRDEIAARVERFAREEAGA
ncbi:MAG TPA: arsenate reductase (thioredoxin) [Bacillales bacterium]|nr:arsenate reductase (thioredoxin) [Bacillales bacterium]